MSRAFSIQKFPFECEASRVPEDWQKDRAASLQSRVVAAMLRAETQPTTCNMVEVAERISASREKSFSRAASQPYWMLRFSSVARAQHTTLTISPFECLLVKSQSHRHSHEQNLVFSLSVYTVIEQLLANPYHFLADMEAFCFVCCF